MKKSLIVERLEAINMSEAERKRALHALQTGNAIADGILGVVRWVRLSRRAARPTLVLKH